MSADGEVNIVDVAIVARAFDSKLGDERWDPNADLNSDGVINMLDIALVAKDFGKSS